MSISTAPTANPLRTLRETLCPSRIQWCRRSGVNYSTTMQGELGFCDRPVRFVAALAAHAGKDEAQLMADYQAWRAAGRQVT